MIIQINILLSLCIPDDPVDDDIEHSVEYGLQRQSNYFGLIPNFRILLSSHLQLLPLI